MATFKRVTRYLFGMLFIGAGVSHFVIPQFFIDIVPPYLPWPRTLVYLSGIAEMGLGALLLFRRWQGLAGWGLIALLIAVFPANLYMAQHPERFPEIPRNALLLRLPLQAVLIAWAYWYTRGKKA